jgi:hypothetical protein
VSEHGETEFGFSGIAGFDQKQAEALERVRSNKRGFLLFTIEDEPDRIVTRFIGSFDGPLGKPFLSNVIETAYEAMVSFMETTDDDDEL